MYISTSYRQTVKRSFFYVVYIYLSRRSRALPCTEFFPLTRRCQSHGMFSLHKSRRSRIPAQTHESVALLGKEHSSDQCHMMQEVCQHFSSSSLAIGRGCMYALPASKGWIMEASHEPEDTLQPFLSVSWWINQFIATNMQHIALSDEKGGSFFLFAVSEEGKAWSFGFCWKVN